MRRIALLWCSALLLVGPASAMRAHDYLDEQRGPVTLRTDRVTPSMELTQPIDTAGVLTPVSDEQLHAPPKPTPHAAPTPSASPVPEPSGWVMLACGTLMLLLVPHKKAEAVFAIPARQC